MKRVLFWVTVSAGVTAAYLMYKRGAPLTQIAQRSIGNPFGTLVNEIEQAAS